ncbi:MAG: phosphate ABC transporter ATP-binding protein [Chlorobia bacterium]|nr:phosphate ABC transporter ATP-binding protein [Fimbriimonadaceae bacterium]
MIHTNGSPTATETPVVIDVNGLSVYYSEKQALKGISAKIHDNKVTTLIGPSGCGKSTFLRTLNRMNDRIPGFRIEGDIKISGKNPYGKGTDLLALRRNVGMVFQKPNPFPMTIYENIALGPKMHYGIKGKQLDDAVEQALREAALWEEVKDDYKKKNGLNLSGGQQQRLCIARMLAVRPEIILMDEPCSALDPISTAKVEELIKQLAGDHTLLVVTHNLQQAERISDYTAFFMFGELVEHGHSATIFGEPSHQSTQDYVSGRFG